MDAKQAKPAEVPPASQTDASFIYRVVIVTLAVVAVGGLVGLFFLALSGKDVPQGLVALPSAAIGAMAGLLIPSPATGGTTPGATRG